MGLPINLQLRYWGIAAALFLALLLLLGNVMLPFVVGGGVAYLLDPVADRLERLGLSRVAATATISVLAVLLFVLLVVSVIPTLAYQLNALVIAAPDIVHQFQQFLRERIPALSDETSAIRQMMAGIGRTVQGQGAELANALLGSALGVINALVFMVVVPVVAFYLLLDWDRLVARVDALMPRDHVAVVRRLARESDDVLAAFVRGQLSVCLVMGLFYAITLMLVGLQFGLIVGVIAGAVTFIPFVGALIGGVLAIGLAFYQFWGDWLSIGLVAGIFMLGQFLEGNVFTPKLVGDSVGLHPVWLLLALSVFGSMFGFLGLLVAVPVAAVAGVMIRFLIGHYQASPLYTGFAGLADKPQDEDQA